jgi:hypothetical protein
MAQDGGPEFKPQYCKKKKKKKSYHLVSICFELKLKFPLCT